MSAQPLIANPKDRFRKLALRLTGLPATASDALSMFKAGVRIAASRGMPVPNSVWRAGLCALLRVPLNASEDALRVAGGDLRKARPVEFNNGISFRLKTHL